MQFNLAKMKMLLPSHKPMEVDASAIARMHRLARPCQEFVPIKIMIIAKRLFAVYSYGFDMLEVKNWAFLRTRFNRYNTKLDILEEMQIYERMAI